MKIIKAVALMLLAFGGGLALWAIGARLSTDAVGMGVGLVFGVLAGFPTALLVFAAAGRRRTDADDAYDMGYRAGVRDTTDMARGYVRQLPEHRPAIVVDAPAQYTLARPFGPAPQLPAPESDPDINPKWHCPAHVEPFVYEAMTGIKQFRDPDDAAKHMVAAAVQLYAQAGEVEP